MIEGIDLGGLAEGIASGILSGLGRALTGWVTSPDLRGEVGGLAGELTEWVLRKLWDGLAWAFGGANIFTSLPPQWTTELPAVRLARERLAPVAAAIVGLGLVAGILLAGLGTIIGRPFGWLLGHLGRILLALAGLAVAPQLVSWFFQFCNVLAGAILDPFGGLPGLDRLSAAGQGLSIGWVALLYLVFAIFFLFQRLKLVVVAALLCAICGLAVAAGALPLDLSQRFFRWWLTTTVGVALVHVLQTVCLGIGANILLVGGGSSGGTDEAVAGLVAAGSLLAAGSVPKLLLGGLAAAAGPSAALGPLLQAATLLAGSGAAGPLFARLTPVGRPLLASPPPAPPSEGTGGAGGYVRSLRGGALLALPPPKP